LDNNIYSTSEAICEYVFKTFKIKYTVKGLVQTLHRLGYSYKKASKTPGKSDIEKQELFVKTYENTYKTIKEDEKVYFVDGCHPTFNNHIGYGWIKTGSRFEIKSQDGRKRINLFGAYNPKENEAFVCEYSTINRDSVVDFMTELRGLNGDKKLHLIGDNARYMHAKLVKEVAKKLNINLVYLPSYSPNLNLIERYWGFLKKHILTNRYYETYESFREAILDFSKNKSIKIKEQLQKYIPEKFHIVKKMVT
jgi:transposase